MRPATWAPSIPRTRLPAKAKNQYQNRVGKDGLLPERRQHVDGVKATVEKDQGCHDEVCYEPELLKGGRPPQMHKP
jgi:hypothetical protein